MKPNTSQPFPVLLVENQRLELAILYLSDSHSIQQPRSLSSINQLCTETNSTDFIQLPLWMVDAESQSPKPPISIDLISCHTSFSPSPPASFKSFGQCTICLFIRFHLLLLHLLKELQSLDPWHWTHTAQDTNGSIVGHDIHVDLLQQVKGQGPTMGAGSDS